MEDKYLFGFSGVVLGSMVSAIFAVLKDVYADSRSKKKEAEYLAIRMVCIFDSFVEGCASVAHDDGMSHGQRDHDGFATFQVIAPELDIQLEDVNWKSLPPELMYEALYFPNLVKDAESYINGTAEFVATAPYFTEAFEERRIQYVRLGLAADELVVKLRAKYKIPKKHACDRDVAKDLQDMGDMVEQQRSERLSKSYEQ
jgi:hypothetical protein